MGECDQQFAEELWRECQAVERWFSTRQRVFDPALRPRESLYDIVGGELDKYLRVKRAVADVRERRCRIAGDVPDSHIVPDGRLMVFLSELILYHGLGVDEGGVTDESDQLAWEFWCSTCAFPV